MVAIIAAWASVACYAAAALGSCYALFAAVAAWRFAGKSFTGKTFTSKTFADPRDALPANLSPVTILKPLHGGEPDLYAQLAGFCRQEYPQPVQIVFGVADAADPATATVRQLIADFPDRDLALVVNARRHGANAKVSNLINMQSAMRHELLILSDSDIVVAADYLRHVVGALERPGVGLVTCLYRGAGSGLWSQLAAMAIDYHFLPNVLVGLRLGMASPCFGSTIALRKATLASIGGFEAVVDQLADDYALGALVRRAGLAVAIPRHIVTHACVERSAGELFRHELRWARTIRSVDPSGFAGLAVTHAVPLALLGLLFGGISPAALTIIVALACRYALALELDSAFALRGRRLWLLPLRDLLSFAIFLASFFGRDIEWRGQRYDVRPDKTLAYYGEVET
ncbi:MAG: bacteriohopanetetrol glucosamine biosynthesis glycosyltransferase HpnI [Xanthobacteraceae bacterium]